ncbi:sensor histidine kinase [Agromyces aerolatus]|uniref:sensor histidine kinase n=1 Tax=Agromyces sp. LY-1074 TaxID=3074080 RepID=UPI00286340BC|nr:MULTISPECIES: ATP-binding protein [unclassified Agromyces]MDR5700434.1 ATP-binding protein [Agromyces sp. LY-1074]MDR5706955.1 ATP-binding protein [Agromyces sp. LY-1358]
MAERRRRAGVVRRVTTAATLVVAVALVVGALVFWATLRASLTAQLDAAAQQDASTLAQQLDALDLDEDDGDDGDGDHGDGDDRDDGGSAGEASDEASAADRDAIEAMLPDLDDDRFVQVIDRDTGAVVAASGAAEDAPALSDRDGSAPGTVQFPGEDDAYASAAERDGDWVVVAGRSTAQAESTLATVGVMLAIAVPLLVALVAVTAWLTARRALAPVERMRREVDAVSGSDLSRRVPEPETSDEIGRLAHTMNGMLARLEASAATQRRFISDASHELKSPLASLRQFAEVALRHPDRISQAELGEAVLDEGARLERLVQGMLVLARADERALALAVTDVDLDDLAFAEARRLGAAATVATDASQVSPARVRGDLGLLQQLVRNLADNAARHAHGRVAFTVATDASGATLLVDDDGAGIPTADRERVFERFVRLDDARARDTGGNGLGLAIVREIAVAHGGSVTIGDSPLGGARVTVRLPNAA